MEFMKEMKQNSDKGKIVFNIFIYLILGFLAFYFVNKNFPNDTFYSIKIGQFIRNNGIDFLDHYCFIKNLSYTYPHFLYDILLSLIYDNFNYLGVYISTIVLVFILAICLYKVNNNLSNKYIGFIVTIFQLILLITFFQARAYLLTFSLFILTYYFIHKYVDKVKFKYFIILIIIAILIANLHVAVFPFYFVLFLPLITEYIISLIIKKKNNLKVEIKTNSNVKNLIILFLVALFTGLLTPLKLVPYTYLINTFRGDSLSVIIEHFPLVLINHIGYLVFLSLIIFILIFKKVKLTLSDWFFFLGMTILSLMQTRQISMAIIFNGFILSKLLIQVINLDYLKKRFQKIYLLCLFFILIILIGILPAEINYLKTKSYINEKEYPVELVKYIKKNINYENKRFYNSYNIGSYLLFNDIPVFIDSRADLYLKEFNEFNGDDIFTDYSNMFTNFDLMIVKYKFDYFIVYKNSDLDILISKGYNYLKLYEDDNYILWKVSD